MRLVLTDTLFVHVSTLIGNSTFSSSYKAQQIQIEASIC